MNLREQLTKAQAEVARIWRAIEREENPTPKRPAMRALEDKLLAQTTFGCDIQFTIDAIRVERDADPESARNHGIWLSDNTSTESEHERLLVTSDPRLDDERLAKHFVVESGAKETHLATEMRWLMKRENSFAASDHETLVLCDLGRAIDKMMTDDRFRPLARSFERIVKLCSATSNEGRAAFDELVAAWANRFGRKAGPHEL